MKWLNILNRMIVWAEKTKYKLAMPPGEWREVTLEERRELQEIPAPSKQELYYRLFQIEDILCDGEDDYDLDRLRELVELYKNVPHICDYCIGCEIEPTDGHGCDGYDNFVFSVRRIVAALKAREQDGNTE